MSLESMLRSAIKGLPGISRVVAERDALRKDCGMFPPGHFYSPIPSLDEVRRDDAQIFAAPPRTLPGIHLRETEQLALLDELGRFYGDIPFPERKTPELRYYYENPFYSYSDAVFLHCMIRHLEPARIVEVGSGFSSCVTLDTRERFFDGAIDVTFIEPYPRILLSLLREGERDRTRILERRLQDVPLEEFAALGRNDILFIDSTHVSRVNSDVNRIFFEILPSLAPGVHIHFHDVFYPFEYPREWIYQGRAWNEAYALRTFLQYNGAFPIVLMNTFLQHFHRALFSERMPLCLKNPGGSIWLRKA